MPTRDNCDQCKRRNRIDRILLSSGLGFLIGSGLSIAILLLAFGFVNDWGMLLLVPLFAMLALTLLVVEAWEQ